MPRPISYAVFCLKKKSKDAPQARRHPASNLHKRQVKCRPTTIYLQALPCVRFHYATTTAATYPLSLHDALPISTQWRKTESANGVHLEGVASDNRSS